jgi:hypothetical protein
MNSLIVGIGFTALGLLGLLFVGRRQFYRRNGFAIEEFDSYTKAAVTGLFERLLSLGSGVLLAFGALLLFTLWLTRIARG